MRNVLRAAQLFRSACVAACLLSPMTASVHAQGSFGVAGVPCSQYTKAARTSDILWHQASQWLLGYVSGMNAALKAVKGSVPPINLTNDQVLKSAGDYCEANPTRTIASAANEWYPSLSVQSEPQVTKQSEPQDSIRLNLTAPMRKPLLDRR